MRTAFLTMGLGAVLIAGAASSLHAQGRGGGPEATIKPGESCPAGMTEIRPLRCMAPQLPAPSILDYRPRSTLITAEHKVARAKFPAIDFHGHPQNLLNSAEGLATLKAAMDSLNLGLMIAAENQSGERLTRTLQLVNASPLKGRVAVFTGIDLQNVGPGWKERAVARLEADVKAGAVGIGEIGKGFGQSTRKADGSRLRMDDPELDPIWEAAARLGMPVFIHTGDPAEFYQPMDNTNERWLELALFPGRRIAEDQVPRFDSLMAERDNLFRRHPRTTFIAAHMGWQANDLATLGKLLDLPNVYTEVGAVLYDIGRQPRAARDFFIKYQDRILFGKDSFQPDEYPYYWRVFETRDDYFDYYRDYHAFWKLYGIDLPDEVLKKVYYKNALRIVKGLPQSGWPD
jgi:predicted TIM-barrel fold metal-dependent hydrolase